ncbi:MAG: hypothetical protein ACTSX9_04265 [Candidatus Njordarchaeales archaeon]
MPHTETILLRTKILIKLDDPKRAYASHMATDVENRLAPKNIFIKQSLAEDTIVFELIAKISNTKPKIETIRRTLDDFLSALIICTRSLEKIQM